MTIANLAKKAVKDLKEKIVLKKNNDVFRDREKSVFFKLSGNERIKRVINRQGCGYFLVKHCVSVPSI